MKKIYYDYEDDNGGFGRCGGRCGVMIMMSKAAAAILNVVILKAFSLLVTSMHLLLRTAHLYF